MINVVTNRTKRTRNITVTGQIAVHVTSGVESLSTELVVVSFGASATFFVTALTKLKTRTPNMKQLNRIVMTTGITATVTLTLNNA